MIVYLLPNLLPALRSISVTDIFPHSLPRSTHSLSNLQHGRHMQVFLAYFSFKSFKSYLVSFCLLDVKVSDRPLTFSLPSMIRRSHIWQIFFLFSLEVLCTFLHLSFVILHLMCYHLLPFPSERALHFSDQCRQPFNRHQEPGLQPTHYGRQGCGCETTAKLWSVKSS